jgi:protocatechuate 3,4-dioxygenase beta subunit
MSRVRNIITFIVSLLFIANHLTTGNVLAFPSCLSTETDIEGPYYLPGAPFRTSIANREEQGVPLIIRGTVFHSDCKTPVNRALVEVWQTDAQGKYYGKDENYRLRGRMRTNEKGKFEFTTVKPGRYRLMKGFRPAHIHVRVYHPDYEVLITQLYFKGDPFLWPHDACGSACKSGDPLRIIELKKFRRGESELFEGTFNIILKPLTG